MRGLGGKSRFSDDGLKHQRNKTDLGFHLLVEGVSAQNFGIYMFSKIFGFYVRLNRTVSRSWLRSFHGFLLKSTGWEPDYYSTLWFCFSNRILGSARLLRRSMKRSVVQSTYNLSRGWRIRNCKSCFGGKSRFSDNGQLDLEMVHNVE